MKNIFITLFLVFIFLALIKVLDISYPLTIVSTTRSSELAVVGEGKIEAAPDMAYVDVGITVDNVPAVSNAQKAIDKTNNEIIGNMSKLGIKKDSIKTSNYSIYPNYSNGNTNSISGYNGNVTINIKTKNISQISKIVEGATEAGANQIQGIRFSIDKPESYREQAREEAIKNAKEQADKLAKKLGIKLGKIVNIVESNSGSPVPVYQDYALKGAGGAESATFEPGSQTIVSTVTLYFEKR